MTLNSEKEQFYIHTYIILAFHNFEIQMEINPKMLIMALNKKLYVLDLMVFKFDEKYILLCFCYHL